MTGRQVRAFGGTRVLIIYDSERVRENRLPGRIEASLDAENIAHVSLGGVVPNPELALVYKELLCVFQYFLGDQAAFMEY